MECIQNSSLKILYSDILAQNRTRLLEGGSADDWLLRPEQDARMAVALLLRIPTEVGERAAAALAPLRERFPELYCYPARDLHITVLDLLRGRAGLPLPSPKQCAAYERCIHNVAARYAPFTVQLRGLTASDGALMLKGWFAEEEGGLNALRADLRCALREEGLPLEERYETCSCHVTAVRFARPLSDPAALLNWVERHADTDFGTFLAAQLEVSYHNWYDSRKQALAQITLGTDRM